MIKQVYLVTYNERFGYADTLEKAKALESQFMASFSSPCEARTCSRREVRNEEQSEKEDTETSDNYTWYWNNGNAESKSPKTRRTRGNRLRMAQEENTRNM